MSWSKTVIGKPENVVAALEAYSEKLNGASKVEYDAALPHMVGLTKQTIGEGKIVKVAATGHGTVDGDGVITSNQCQISIEVLFAEIV